ncbi:hypothetical protein HPB51_025734 [Rhipicephalus microplus]|uniref:Uncharacterized protein n=1 Tax=Rhipicephalus microplus TaxID=6941 RepID=A0A9J6FAV7_RHIMP|nr:hypothetical protein HPB51_025734 [Rhipicephalus microplus]
MYADTAGKLEAATAELKALQDEAFVSRVETFLRQQEEWVQRYRLDVLTRGHNTNFAEATILVLKDIILTELKHLMQYFPLPPAEPLSALEYFDMFVSRSMLKAVVDESNKYYFQKHGTPLNLTVEELTSVLGMFSRMGLVNMHRMSTSAATKVFMAARVATSLGWELVSCSSCVPAYRSETTT